MKALRPLVTAVALLLAVASQVSLGAPAEASGLPAVRSLHVVSQVDRAARIAWSAPDTARTVARYRVVWGDHLVRLAPTARSYAVQGLRNGVAVRVGVQPVYRSGARGDLRTVVATGAGRPVAPAAPGLSSRQNPGNGSTIVTVVWPAVAPNGPGPTSYAMRRTDASGSYLICGWTTDTSCVDVIDNDGGTATYQVRARNAEATSVRASGHQQDYTSVFGPGSSIVATAAPDAPVITGLQATGTDGEATLHFDLGPSHGVANTVTAYAGGVVLATWEYSTSGSHGESRTLTGLSNGASTPITLRACNGGAANLCSTSASSSVTTYGPVGAVSSSTSVDADQSDVVHWSVSADPNGRPLTWALSRTDGTNPYVTIASGTTGTAAFARTGSETVGTGRTYAYRFVVSDSARPEKSSTTYVTIPGPASPMIYAMKGAVVSPGSGCSGTCWYIKSQPSSFPGTATCGAYAAANDALIGATWAQPPWTVETSNWVGSGLPFYLSCTNGARSATTTW